MDENEPLNHKKKTIKNKAIYLICTCSMLIGLIGVYYFFFYHTISVDLTEKITITYEGESNFATANIEGNYEGYNQRIQPFYDSIQFDIEPNNNLSNGDIVKVAVIYDEELAKAYHIEVINNEKEFEVSGLAERYKTVANIPAEYLDMIEKSGRSYIEKNTEKILIEDIDEFDATKKVELNEPKKLHSIFLKAEKADDKDKLIEVYEFTVKGTSKEKQEEVELKVPYLIVFDNVNTKKELSDENIFGEKIKNAEDMTDVNNALAYLKGKYLLNYEMVVVKK